MITNDPHPRTNVDGPLRVSRAIVRVWRCTISAAIQNTRLQTCVAVHHGQNEPVLIMMMTKPTDPNMPRRMNQISDEGWFLLRIQDTSMPVNHARPTKDTGQARPGMVPQGPLVTLAQPLSGPHPGSVGMIPIFSPTRTADATTLPMMAIKAIVQRQLRPLWLLMESTFYMRSGVSMPRMSSPSTSTRRASMDKRSLEARVAPSSDLSTGQF